MNKFIKNDFIKIISGSNKNKFGKIKKIKNNLIFIKELNNLNKFFKLRIFNKIKFFFKTVNIPINVSNISYYNYGLCKIGFFKKFNDKFRFLRKNGIFNEIL